MSAFVRDLPDSANDRPYYPEDFGSQEGQTTASTVSGTLFGGINIPVQEVFVYNGGTVNVWIRVGATTQSLTAVVGHGIRLAPGQTLILDHSPDVSGSKVIAESSTALLSWEAHG